MHRYKSQARLHVGRTVSGNADTINGGAILPLYQPDGSNEKAGGLNDNDVGPGSPSGSAAFAHSGDSHGHGVLAGGGSGGGVPEVSKVQSPAGVASESAQPPLLEQNTEAARDGDTAITPTEGEKPVKGSLPSRAWAGSKRFGKHTKRAISRSWINVLLLFVPIGIIAEAVGLNDSIIFAMNAVAIVPLAGLLAYATESVAARMGDTLGALLNVSFGNAVELIIFIIALVKGEISIVRASLLGSILANLLLILGMAFLFGGLRYREQIYNSTVTQMSACLLSLSVMSLLLPTAFHASFNEASAAAADKAVLQVSRGTSVILLLVYVLYLLFQLKTHAYMYESTPQAIIDEESHPGVLHDIMNSSSSSSDTSSSDSTDSDTSGSIMTHGKRLRKKMFKNRRRRKSNASVSSTTASSAVPSAISSPSTMERQGSYWEHQVQHAPTSRRESALGAIASGDEADADDEGKRQGIMPRIRDFVQNNENAQAEGSKSPERRKSKRKHHRKHHHKRRHHHDEEKEAMKQDDEIAPGAKVKEHTNAEPKVGFADDVEFVREQNEAQDTVTPGRLALNMRNISSHVGRPALPKYLSNTVFSSPAPQPDAPKPRPAMPQLSRARSEAFGLRRASSLPDFNKQRTNSPKPGPLAPSRSDPVPPFQAQVEKSRTTGLSEASKGEDEEGEENMSRTAAVVLLLCSTALVAVCAEFMVDAIPNMVASSPISEAFIGLIILPIVGNAAEHVTAVTVAAKNKMDLAIGVAIGSSIQIALFVTPIVVLLGWILHTDMSLYFNLFETISLFVTAFVVNFLILDGRSNYLEGSLLIAAYIIIALGAYFYPSSDIQSAVGGAGVQ
ncbi:hypothetical protein LTR78_000715 [Recurvomyces mirabilis]|uniref:Sodium/calcium exchanger membrane region domain-containing protein n=1 Tax=Recurvomyces mirabilis TaxID=574656 RepID=A0AAE0WVZ8_9PEZI|nr:hypothetical protein LTR78_000715 [Recurvomyces mirabilis]KAK5158685.1 hypothetical protein LTS14_002793 [Recurvomyces mirabilis]